MSWFNPFSWHTKPPITPKDPESAIKGLMRSAPKTGNSNIDANHDMKQELLGSFKKGGKVKKTGAYKLHKGETVVPVKKDMAAKMNRSKTWGDLTDKEREYLMDAGHFGPHLH